MLGLTFPARAALERVGPVSNDPRVGGFPAWYQDTTGLALEFCDPLTTSEVAGGWCLLLPGDVTIPEAFPNNFFDEHFYYAADASLTPQIGKALVRLAVEAAFATAVQPGDQITFARIRVKLTDIPVTGTYRFIHPYGEESIFANAGEPRGIFFTDDVGIGAQGDFSGALNSRLGPFLVAAATPGGAEIAAVTAANPTPDTDPAHFGGAFAPTAYPGTGKAYLADPARIGPITGSPLKSFIDSSGATRNHNIFRIEGPAGSNLGGPGVDSIETTNFTLMGRAFSDTIPGRVTIDRASYTASASAKKLDVFASGFQTTQGRLPTQARPTPVQPQLSFYEAPCATDANGAFTAPASLTDMQMFQAGTNFSAQSQPLTIPTSVCVKDGAARDVTGQIVPAYFQTSVTDEIAITKALYDYDSQTLTVNATSSDTTATPPSLSLDGFGSLTAGTFTTATPLAASPAKVRVRSSVGGVTELLVSTNFSGAAPGALRAVNDAFTVNEDAGAQIFNVLANDTSAAGGTVAVLSQPRLGSAIANANGTVTYTATLNANGADSFTYQVTTAAGKSNIANVAITINPVNDPPTAVNDGTFTVKAGVATQLPNLLDNDQDADGRIDLVAAVQIVAPAGVTVTGGTNGLVTFTAATAGTYTFTYRTQDKAGVISANSATVTVSVISADTVTMTSALYRFDQKRWVVSGTSSVGGQTLTLTYVDGGPLVVGHAIATNVPIDALGNWTLDIRGATGLDDPSTLPLGQRPTRLKATSSLTGTATIAITYK